MPLGKARAAGTATSSLALLACLAARLPAQVPSSRDGSTDVVATSLAQDLRVLAADSFRDRRTPSAGLDRMAQYIAAEFQRIGLQQGIHPADGSPSTWVQRYIIPGQRHVDYTQSQVEFVLLDQAQQGQPPARPQYTNCNVSLQNAGYLLTEVAAPIVSEPIVKGFNFQLAGSEHVVLLTGRHTPTSVRSVDVADKVVLFAPPAGMDTADRRAILAHLYQRSHGAILLVADSAEVAARAQAAPPVPIVDAYMHDAEGVQEWPWAAAVWAGAVRAVVVAAGVDPARLFVDDAPAVHDVTGASAWIDVAADTMPGHATAPNVVGILDGTDSVLKRASLVVSARMDNTGVNGNADLGLAGLLALAKAFSQPNARPRRSMIFIASSGSGAGMNAWGTNYFADRGTLSMSGFGPLTAAVTLDVAGPASDTVVLDGAADLKFSKPPSWLATAHPELHLAITEKPTTLRSNASHYPFARRAIPGLSLDFEASPAPSHDPAVSAPVDSVHAVRALRLAYYVVEMIADANQRLQWRTDTRERFAKVITP